jgi:hypothetical protein
VRRGSTHESSRAAWRLDLGEMRWEHVADLLRKRCNHACCAVRGSVVVLGGGSDDDVEPYEPGSSGNTASVEVLRYDSEADGEYVVEALPPLSCGAWNDGVAIAIDESEGELGQVLMIGGCDWGASITEAVYKVDLATGACTPQEPLQYGREQFAGARLADGRVVCAGGVSLFDDDGYYGESSPCRLAEIYEPPEQGAPSQLWRWRELPFMSAHRSGCAGCVLSDGRFAVFGGLNDDNYYVSSCEVLTLDGDNERWEPLPPMHEDRAGFACAAVGGCVIVAGGYNSVTAEVYEEALGRWRRLPCGFPYELPEYWCMGSALM